MKINRDIYIEDLVREFPQLVRPLKEHNLVCIACGEPVWGTLGELAEVRAVENLDEIILEMNNLVAESGNDAG